MRSLAIAFGALVLAGCHAGVGGRFRPRLLGWMVHVMAFAGDDPRVIWGGEGGGHHH
jgi:hypothetical protein